MWVSEITENNLTNDVIDHLLYEGLYDEGKNVDCIIVLGSSKAVKYRVPVAVEAYFVGRSRRIMFCGGAKKNASSENLSEAEEMCQKAIELGVPETSIIMESTSQNTVENIVCSLVELQRAMWLNRVKSVLLVTTTYHMRRSLHIARYLFPPHITVYPCPADDLTTRRDNWMNTNKGTDRAKAEALNIVRCVRNGVFPDFEI